MTTNFKAPVAKLSTDDDLLDVFKPADSDDQASTVTWGAPAVFSTPTYFSGAPSEAPAGATSSSSGPSITTHTGGFVINATIGAGAPTGFAAAVQGAIQYFESTFTNNLTMNITFDWGSTGGIASSSTGVGTYSYSSVVSALQSQDALIAADSGLVLPSTDPFPAGTSANYAIATPANTLWLTNGEATLLGLSNYNAGSNTNDDATITLGSGNSYNFNPAGGAVAGEFDATPIFEHEISEVMGRQFGGNNTSGNGLLPEALALFRYSSSGVLDTSDNYAGGYFSINGGVTNLRSNMGEQNGDLADWGDATDDVVGYAQEGVAQEFTPVDVQVMEALGWATTTTNTDDTWTGGTANWNTADDWSAGVPTSTSNVFIPQGDPEITTAVSVASVSVENGATLSVGDELTIGAGGLTLESGSTLNVTTPETFGFDVDVAGNATIDDNGGFYTYFEGTVSGTGSLTVDGAGGLVFTAANTGFSGNVTMAGGYLAVFNAASLGTGALTLDDDAYLQILTNGTISNNIDVSGNANIDIFSGDDVTLSGVIANGAGAGAVTIIGGGTIALSGANTYTGATTVYGTTLSIGADDNISATSLTLDDATLELTGATQLYFVPITLANAATIVNTAQGIPYFQGIVSGTGSLTLNSSGGGAIVLDGTNTYSGGTTVTAVSNLAIFNDDALGSNTLTLDDCYFQPSVDGPLTNAITAIGSVSFIVVNGYTPTLSGIISDGSSPGALTFYDGGTITLSGANTYSGGTTIDSGTTVAISGSGTLGTGGVTLDSGATLSIGAGAAPTITGLSSFAGTVSGAGTWSLGGGDDTIASGAKITVSNWSTKNAGVFLDEALTYSGAFTGGASTALVLNGFNLTLKGATTLSGATTAGSGRLLTQAATTVSGGLTIGGTGGMTNSATLTEKGAAVTLGDTVAGDKVTVTNTSTGVWNLTDANGLARGANASSLFTNQGTFEKTAGATSVIGASFTNTGTVNAKVGIIDFAGPVTTMSGVLEGGAAQFTAGATTFNSGANVTVSQISLSGSSSMTIASSLTYSGKFTQSTGTTLSINPSQILTLKGAATLNGVVHGSGELLMSGGTLLLGVGGPIVPGSWVNTGEAITVTGSRGYSGTFSADSTTTINLSGGALALSGATTLTGATTEGSKLLTLAAATTINGLTIGGTGGLENKKTTTQSGGTVTLGDSTGDKATLTNISTGTWDITDDSSIFIGSSTASSIVNAGILEKTGGTGPIGSSIMPAISNTGKIEASSGVFDLQGAITGTGKDIISGASTLILESSVASGQTVSFTGAGGALQLLDPQAFAATISGFDTGAASGDTLELSSAWTYTGFTENAGHTEGTMTVANGGQTASLLFAGNYNSALFHPVTNSGGTFVTYG